MKLLKEFAWKAACGYILYMASFLPFKDIPFWKSSVCWFLFYVSLDLIRWGLKKED